MINPCNSKQHYIQFEPTYNLPTRYGNRIALEPTIPTSEMFEKHKLLLLKNTTITGGPGILNSLNTSTQIPYTLNKNSVQRNNKIYKIPCRFKPYISEIQSLLNEGNSVQSVLSIITTKYNLKDITLKNSFYQNKKMYIYPYAISTGLKQNINSVSINIPFKIGESVTANIQDIVDDIILKPNMFATSQYAKTIYVSTNDGKSFTTMFNELLPNGSASFFGSSLLTDDDIQHPDRKWQLYVFILPHYQTQYKSYGYIVDSSKYNILNLSGLIFIPIQTYESLITYQPYPTNMPFTIKYNETEQLNTFTTPCKFKSYATVNKQQN
jgi:hypothetical protein